MFRELSAQAAIDDGRSPRCLFSDTRPRHRCDGSTEFHHLIEAQFLRTHFSTMGEARWRLVYAPDIAAPLCSAGHGLVTVHATYVHWQELPARAIAWASKWGIKYRLRRECPPLSVSEQNRRRRELEEVL